MMEPLVDTEARPAPEPGLNGRGALLQSETVRRRVGRLMIATAVGAAVLAVVVTVVVWRLIGAINQTTGDTLDVTIDALASMESTVELADDLIGSTVASLAAVETTLETVSGSFETSSETLTEVGDLTETAEPTLRNAEGTLRVLEDLGSEIDGLLVGLSAVPFGPDYNPNTGLGVTFGQLADDLAPLPDELAATSDSLRSLQTDVGALTASVKDLNRDLADSEVLLVEYRANVNRAQDVARASRDGLDQDVTLLRVLVVAVAVNVLLAQLVPLWIGWGLITGTRADDE